MTEKCYKPLYGKCFCLTERHEKFDCALGVEPSVRAKLCQELGTDYYTYLVIYDGECHEIVKVEADNRLLYIQRGIDDTDKQAWPCGTKVKWDMTPSGMSDLASQQGKKLDEECPEKRFTGSIKNGNCTVYFKDGIAIEQTPNKHQIPDGCYTHPVPTYKDGCLVKIANGSPSVHMNTCVKDTCE